MIENILGRLSKVKPSGKGRWNACCPAHQDKSPSLSVRVLDDGRILMHCFGGCDVGEVLGALSLTIEDLFPERLSDAKPERAPFNAYDVLKGISYELTIVALLASKLASSPLADKERDRLFLSISRVNESLRLAGVNNA
jgi:hypothetical protein